MKAFLIYLEKVTLRLVMTLGKMFAPAESARLWNVLSFMARDRTKLPDFGPEEYFDNRNHTAGYWRFTLAEDTLVPLAPHLGIKGPIESVPAGHFVVFRSQDGKIRATLYPDQSLMVRRGYAWDGCSPKWWAMGRWWGTPDPECTRLASLVHDVLYQFGNTEHFPYNRDAADMAFYNIIIAKSGDRHFAGTYYGAVRIMGGRYFKGNHGSSQLIRDAN